MKNIQQLQKEALNKFLDNSRLAKGPVVKMRLTPVHDEIAKKPLKLTHDNIWTQILSFLLWSLGVLVMAYCSSF